RHGHVVGTAAFSPDGRRVVTGSDDQTARVWDASSGQAVSPALPHGSSVVDASFSPDGRWVVTASVDGTARLWDAVTGQPPPTAMEHRRGASSRGFTPGGAPRRPRHPPHPGPVLGRGHGPPAGPAAEARGRCNERRV